MDTSIELKNLSTGYKIRGGRKVIASDLNAELQYGEMVCLLGPNGAGKSTLLRTLSAFQQPLSGQIEVGGQDISQYSSKELAKLISVVLTDNSGIKNMTAWDVVAMGRSPYTNYWGKLTDADKKIVRKCLEWVDIEDLAPRKMQSLSDGEKQKVMIAKAIAQQTKIIILDEPTAYLDYPSKIAMMMLLHRLAKTLKKTVFLSTHDLEHALQIADKVWLIDQKLGLTTGLPEDLSLDGSIEKYFSREGISFEKESCIFSIHHETGRDVLIEGDEQSLDYRLCCKAMTRNGMRPVRKIEEGAAGSRDVMVRVPGDGTFRLIEKGRESIKVEKIEHILHMIVPTITKYQISAIRESAEMNQYE